MLVDLVQKARAILFDFDGVLVDSEPVHYGVFRAIFEKHGHDLDENDYWKHWTILGEGVRGELHRHGLDHLDPDELQEEKNRNFLAACHSGVIPFDPGARSLVAAFRSVGKLVSIASNSPRDQIDAILHSADPTTVPEFDAIIGRSPELAKKPAPDIFLAAARALDMPPEDCLVFEDADKGLRAAIAARMPCVILRTDQNRNFTFEGEDAIAESLAEIESALGENSVE
jgi:HAD superfamily hydrolase (TIGR01509 family)